MKISKKLIVSMVIGVQILPLSVASIASASPAISVVLDGKTLKFDQPPVIKNNRTLVPLRGIFEGLGASVKWNAKTKTITAAKAGTVINLQIGSRKAKINSKQAVLDVEAQMINGRTMVPMRFVGEAFGAQVIWNASARSVVISSKVVIGPVVPVPAPAPAPQPVVPSGGGSTGSTPAPSQGQGSTDQTNAVPAVKSFDSVEFIIGTSTVKVVLDTADASKYDVSVLGTKLAYGEKGYFYGDIHASSDKVKAAKPVVTKK